MKLAPVFLCVPAIVWAANTIQPGALTADRPTPTALGVRLAYSGDDNRNAIATIQYRRAGDATFLDGLPLHRVRPETVAGRTVAREFAGSIFDLRPGTTYDIRVRLVDSDNPLDTTFTQTQTTRVVPAGPITPRIVTVFDAAGLNQAISSSAPGDIITLQPGVYPVEFLGFYRSGTASNPIVVRGVDRDSVILDGGNCGGCNLIEVYADYIHIESLTLRNGFQAIRYQNNNGIGNVFRRNAVRNVVNGINCRDNNQRDFYFADNTLAGRIQFPLTNPDGDFNNVNTYGIVVCGFGHVVANNQIMGFGDGIRVAGSTNRAHDITGNDILYAYDDGVELDAGEGNVRFLRNRLSNVYQGISMQPVHGGPVYIIRNSAVNVKLAQLKIHGLATSPTQEPSGSRIYHNTFLSTFQAFTMYGGVTVHNTVMKNNLFAGPEPTRPTVSEWYAPLNDTVIDYNGYYPAGGFTFILPGGETRFPSLAALAANGFAESRGRIVNRDTFANGLVAPVVFSDYQYPPQHMLLSASSTAIDGGERLTGVNDNFTGSAPDLGAFERGCPVPPYGPRPESIDESNQVFGCSPNAVSNTTPEGLSAEWRGRGLTTFTAAYRDADGSADIQTATILISRIETFANACAVELDRPLSRIYLWNDAGAARLGPVAFGSARKIENGQCIVQGTGASASLDSATNALRWTVTTRFKAVFQGTRNVILRATDVPGGVGAQRIIGTLP